MIATPELLSHHLIFSMRFDPKIFVFGLLAAVVSAQSGKRSSGSASSDSSTSGKKGMSMTEAPEHMIDFHCATDLDVPLCAAPTPAQEDRPAVGFSTVIDSCGFEITAPGIYYLEDDVTCEAAPGVTPAPPIGININSGHDDRIDGTVIIDCKGECVKV